MLRWRVREMDPEIIGHLADDVGITPLSARMLLNRGIDTAEDAARFLNPSLDDLHDPMLLPDCDKAVTEIAGAIERKEVIFVHGDYDVDGITSSALWTRSLRRMGANVHVHLPHRQKDGYGVHENAIHKAKELGAKLLLTCDCGTGAGSLVDMAHEFGMRVVITDHHQPGETLPSAEAVVNPMRRDSEYPYPFLCGVGVSFKVAEALVRELDFPVDAFRRAYLDLVALGTVADVVPLTGENRILTRFGLPKIAESKKAGLKALLKVCEYSKRPDEVSAYDVGFVFGPRINAAGRMDDAHDALKLMLTEEVAEAFQLARTLDQHNIERRREQQRIFEEALIQIEEQELTKNKLLLVAGEGWNPGVVGIVASKLVDRFSRPALVGCRIDGRIVGSARSIDAFNLFEALSAHLDKFIGAGGHWHAAGFSFDEERFEEIEHALTMYAEGKLTDDDLVPECVADAEVYPHEVTERFVQELENFGPFGHGNPQPMLLGRRVTLLSVEPTRNPLHPKVTLRGDATNPIYGMAFGLGERLADFPAGCEVDMLFEPVYDRWNGAKRLRWHVRDLRPLEVGAIGVG